MSEVNIESNCYPRGLRIDRFIHTILRRRPGQIGIILYWLSITTQ